MTTPRPSPAHPLLAGIALTLIAVNPATPLAALFGAAAAGFVLLAVARAQPKDPLVVAVTAGARAMRLALAPANGGRRNARGRVRVIAVAW